MNVNELIEILKQEDGNRIVIMSKDGEGNNYSPLADIEPASYQADSTYSGYVGLEKLTEDAISEGFTEEDVVDGEYALVFYPVN